METPRWAFDEDAALVAVETPGYWRCQDYGMFAKSKCEVKTA